MKKEATKKYISSLVRIDSNGCWIFAGKPTVYGYGQINVGGKRWRVHRLSYVLFKGKIPKGKVIHHLCRVRNCVNPEHLEAVFQKENLLAEGSQCIAAINKAKTECPIGHPLVGKNVRFDGGKRHCYTCMRNSIRKYQSKIKRISDNK